MKKFLLLFVLFVLVSTFTYTQKNDVTIEIKKVGRVSENGLYAVSPPSADGMAVIRKYIKEGAWHLLESYFLDAQVYSSFLLKLAYELDDPKFSHKQKKGYNTLLSRIKPYSLERAVGNTINLIDVVDSSKVALTFSTLTIDNRFKIGGVTVDIQPSQNAQSLTAFSTGAPFAKESDFSYVLLPTETTYPDYMNHFSEAYGAYRIEDETSETMPFQQIDFDPLQIEFKWCKKVLFVNKCGTETYVLEYGPVISQKDDPNGSLTDHFSEIADITAYASSLNENEYSPNGNDYLLTSVIVDAERRQLTFLREGLEPWKYGLKPNDIHFKKPIAAKVIDGILYILDHGNDVEKPSIKVFQVYNTIVQETEEGDFGLTYLGVIDHTTLSGFQLSNVVDIGGFEADVATDPNILLVADRNGLHSIALNKATGLPETSPNIRSFSQVQDPLDADRYYFIRNIRRIDGRKANDALDRGNVVIITDNNQIISLSNLQVTSENTSDYLRSDYYTALSGTNQPNNLAYMFSEQKWYVTDFFGKIHKLNKDGKYISGGGVSGKNELNNELYFPIAITPNPIQDLENDFRYRYIVANEWGYDTGFKLFAPDLTIPEFKMLENLSNGTLSFTFTTSGRWEFVEKANGITFESLSLNETTLDPNLWNNQIAPGTVSTPGDDLTSVPNIINISPSNLPMLKRGWNKAQISIKLYMNGVPDRIIEKDIYFYWLPSSFTPTSFTDGDFKLNRYSTTDRRIADFIYKPITLGNGAALYSNHSNLYIANEGQVTFENGATFYNVSGSEDPLENVKFSSFSNLTFNDGSYICVNTTNSESYLQEFSYPVYFTFEPGYRLGTNPPDLPEYAESQCHSPCNFLAKGEPEATFTHQIDYDVNNNFLISVDPEGTTYADRVKWEVEKVVAEGQPNGHAFIVLEEPPVNTDLSQVLDYTFETCSKYKITLSIGCNETDWLTSVSNIISTPRCEAKLAAGYFHTMKIKPDGTLWAWGNNDFGQLGDGSLMSKNIPIQVGNEKWKTVSSGYFHSLGIKEGGTLWAWGYNGYGQVGDGTYVDKIIPKQIGSDNDWKSVSVGATHSVALKEDGSLWAWGGNDYGQLGIGSDDYSNSPVRIGTENNWAKISSGYYYTLALKTEGSLWGWGYNGVGQLGDGTNTDKLSPILIGTENDWSIIGNGGDHSMAIKADGTLWTWGYNLNGQLGDGTTINRNAPQILGDYTGWRNILGGELHSMGIRADGTLWAWGNNSYGQLGDETSANKHVPSIVRLETNWESLTLGGSHSVVTSIDKICAVGSNNYGQLGDGTFIDKSYFNCDVEPLNDINQNAEMVASIGVRLREQDLHSLRWNETFEKSKIFLEQNYPNPSNHLTYINYTIPPHVKKAKIIIYSEISSSKVSEYDLPVGSETLEIDLSALKPGIYIYELLIDGNKKGVKRMVVIR